MIRRRAWLGCVVGGLVLVLLGIVLDLDRGRPAASGRAVPIVNIGRVPPAQRPPAQLHRHPSEVPRPLPVGSRLRIAGAAVDAAIRRVHLVGHELQVPHDPRLVGWWTGSAAPGDRQGTVVIVGHVNYAGVTGALAVLPSLRPGEAVSIAESRQAVRYRVAAVRTYPKTTGIPDSVFAQTGSPRLVLITCGGPFDRATGNYLDNIVAFARPSR